MKRFEAKGFVQLWTRVATSMVLLSLAACSSMHGVPVRYQDTSATVTAINLKAEDLANLVTAKAGNERNDIVNKAIGVIDLRFHELVRAVNGDRQDSAAITSYGNIAFNTAGTLVSSVVAKTNYAAAAAVSSALLGVTEKQYYFDKTLPALVAAMIAARVTVEERLRSGMQQDIYEYPGSMALADLESYFSAGTLLAAISNITKRAEQETADKLEDVRAIPAVTAEELTERRTIRNAINSISAKNLQLGRAALTAAGLADKQSVTDVRKALLDYYRTQTRSGNVAGVTTALKAAKLIN